MTADDRLPKPCFLLIGFQFGGIGGNSFKFQGVDRFNVSVYLNERSGIGQQFDPLRCGHRVVITAVRADVQVAFFLLGKNSGVTFLAFFPETLRNILALQGFFPLGFGTQCRIFRFFEKSHFQFLCLRAMTRTSTRAAPPLSKTPAASLSVAPVVITSSTNNILHFSAAVESKSEKAP